ncbi:MAG: WG repeat-containing protein [Bacillota bacterium]
MKKKLFIAILSFILMTFIVGCTNTKYEVEFIVNDSIEEVIEVEDGQTVNKIDDPVSEDYLFLGWYTSDNYEEKFNFNQEIKSDKTIYAAFSHFKLGEENYIAFKENDLYGFMLPTGEVVIEAIYERAEPFRYGYALVYKGEISYYIDALGNKIYEQSGYLASGQKWELQFSKDGLAIVRMDDAIKVIDTEGSVHSEITLPEDVSLPAGTYIEDGRILDFKFNHQKSAYECIYLDMTGDIVLEDSYLQCSPFVNGLAAVKIVTGSYEQNNLKSTYHFITPDGEIMIETNLSNIKPMFDGIRRVFYKDGFAIGVLNQSDFSYPRYVVIDDQGEIVVEFENDIPVDVYDGYVLTKNSEGYYAIFDLEGNIIMDYLYQGSRDSRYAMAISDGLVVLRNDNDLYGAIDVNTGDLVIDFTYESLLTFIDGYAVAQMNGLYGIIDKDNNVIVDFIYEDMFSVAKTYNRSCFPSDFFCNY